MGKLQRLFKHTFIYGIATVLPRVLALVLTPLYINKLPHESNYGVYAVIMSYMILGNVVLSYGMETAFFRFINKNEKKEITQSTALTSLTVSSVIFGLLGFLLRHQLASWTGIEVDFVLYAIAILVLDALVVIPFAWFRNAGKSLTYAFVKIGNVIINLSLNLFFFLLLPILLRDETSSFWSNFETENKVHYIFIANLIASFVTFVFLLRVYKKIKFGFNWELWKQMFWYAFPVLLAGIAFSINEGFDRIFLQQLSPADKADSIVGVYAACYKMGVFMTLFITAYKLGIEPFFFSNAKEKDAQKTYATVTLYFVIFGSFILLFITTYTDIFKQILIPNSDYWEALWIVPFILLANLCLGIYHSLSVWYKVTDRTYYGAYISIIGGVITVVMNYLLIPIFSYKGAAIATLCAYATMMFVSYFIGQKKYPIPYNIKKIALYLGYSVLASLSTFFIFDRNIWVGTFLMITFLIMVFYGEREVIISIVRKVILRK